MYDIWICEFCGIIRAGTLLLSAAILLSAGCGTVEEPCDAPGRHLLIERDAMVGCNHGCYDLSAAFRDVRAEDTFGCVELHVDNDTIPVIEELLTGTANGPYAYALSQRSLIGVEFPDTSWQIYVLGAYMHTRYDGMPEYVEEYGLDVKAGEAWVSEDPSVYNECIVIVYVQSILNFVNDPYFRECYELDFEVATRAITLHELGHCFGLEDVDPLKDPWAGPCDPPLNLCMMVRDMHQWTLREYTDDEIDAIRAFGRP